MKPLSVLVPELTATLKSARDVRADGQAMVTSKRQRAGRDAREGARMCAPTFQAKRASLHIDGAAVVERHAVTHHCADRS